VAVGEQLRSETPHLLRPREKRHLHVAHDRVAPPVPEDAAAPAYSTREGLHVGALEVADAHDLHIVVKEARRLVVMVAV